MTGNCVPAREGGEQPKARLAARNDSEVHPMSPENPQPVVPSFFKTGEGCQGRTMANPAMSRKGLNDGLCGRLYGVVRGRGMQDKGYGVKGGALDEWTAASNGGHKRLNREARLAQREVGVVRSSDSAANPRAAKGPHLVGVNGEVRSAAMASFGEIATTRNTRWLQWTLCRRAKSTRSTAPAVNGLGERNAGNPPVTFDEGRGVVRGTFNG